MPCEQRVPRVVHAAVNTIGDNVVGFCRLNSKGVREKNMKRVFTILGTIALAWVTVSSGYAGEKGIGGTWTFRASELSLRLVLVQKGKQITGTLQNPHGNPIQLKGQFSGNQLKFTGSSEGGEWAYRLSGTGTLQSDGSFAGSLTSNVG